MLVAHPVVLYMLVERYEALRARPAGENDAEAGRHRDDLAVALCAATGAPDVEAALRAARRLLPGTGKEVGGS
ncbi:DUF5133 domain-containing protein [Streptomyces sp. NPDC088354]|uniref:DUF5133 domain-containing protein n=1 Tax=unclassified Streptomyces TaxID=2593676 RepID=UPI0029A24FA2|nr:DUF5133 domain-containing protein [Streptomyces sp. MI02-7b]MDX3072939.1 DUF5133 domain-containing protein [Streptomyces sp. MI02-7b]